ncbi:MAG: DNA replication protein DnaC [Psychromonas sp.]|jgi:DNA replication protein DnaC
MQGVRSKLVCERHNKKCVNAGISPRFIGNDINNFPVTTNNQFIAVNAVNCFLFNFPDVSNMLMIGSVGTGKTLLASCIVESLVDNHNCEIVKLMDMIRKLKGSWSKSSEFEESDIIDHYSNLDLLVIDEIGVQRGTDTEKMFIFDVIDNRYQQRRPTILISNLTRESVSAVIGERCMDRLKQDGGFEIAFDWGSLRC